VFQHRRAQRACTNHRPLRVLLALLAAGLGGCARPNDQSDRLAAQLVAQHWRAPLALSVAPQPPCLVARAPTTRVASSVLVCPDSPHDPAASVGLAVHAATLAAAYTRDSAPQIAHALALLEISSAPDSTALDHAVALLRRAQAGAPHDAAITLDLSSGLLLRYGERQTIGDLLEALDVLGDSVLTLPTVEHPLNAPPILRAACVNRVVALTWLSATTAAREAAQSCTSEVMTLVDFMATPDRIDTMAVATNGRWPAFAFDHATTRLLPAVARAQRLGDAAEAERRGAELMRVRIALLKRGEDSTVVRVMERLSHIGDPASARLARAVELYGELRGNAFGEPPRAAAVLLDSIDQLTTPTDDVRAWATLVRANLALTGEPRRPREALQLYEALGALFPWFTHVLGARVAFNEAITRMALGEQTTALRMLVEQAAVCHATNRNDCALTAATMGASLASLLGDEAQSARLLAYGAGSADGPLRPQHWSLLSALREEAERVGLPRAAEVLFAEMESVAARLVRADLQAEATVLHAHGRVLASDTAAVRRDLDELLSLMRTSLSPADQRYFAAEALWLEGAWRLATGRPGARVKLDSAVQALAADSNSVRTARPMLLRARATAAEGDTTSALMAFDALLRTLHAHGAAGATVFERERLRAVASEAGTEAARLLLARGMVAQAVKAAGGDAFADVIEPAHTSATRVDVGVRRLNADSVLVWSRVGATWAHHIADVPLSLTMREDVVDDASALTQLHTALLAPVLRRAGATMRTMRVDARGDLAVLPWSALSDAVGGTPLVQQYAVWFTDDLWRIDSDAPPLRDPRVLVVDAAPTKGRTALYGATEEVLRVADTWGARAQVLAAARGMSAVVRAWGQADVVHYSGHAVLDAARPERSYLAIGNVGDRRFTGAWMAEGQPLSAQLVVLAACDTRGVSTASRGREGRDGRGWSGGTGLASLANGLQDAGAQQVIGALWPIDDAATQAFMVDLHRALRDGKTAAEALQAAQVASVESEDPARRTPRVWAAFQLLGR
jgi:CHAT domain-containing protein